MKSYLPPNNTARNTIINSRENAGVRPMIEANNPDRPPLTPVTMQQLRPNETYNNIDNEKNYQQHQLQSDMHGNRPQNQQIHPQQQQQNNLLQNHFQQQKINIHGNNLQQQNNLLQNHPEQQQPNRPHPGVLLRQDLAKLQIDPTNKANVPNQYNRGEGIPFEGQRTQMAAQVRLSHPGQSIRPPLISPNSGAPLHQSPNYNNQDALKVEINRIRPNFENINPDSCKTQVFRGNPINPEKKLLDMDINSFDAIDTHPKLNEPITNITPKGLQQGNASRADTERKSDLINAQATVPPESKFDQNDPIVDSNDVRSNSERTMRSGNKVTEKSLKEDNRNNTKDGSIPSGMVRKSIKFFEENDTARKPLTPTKATVEKRKKVTDVPSDVIKSEFYKNDYESGVDETPVVHPNLGNIFQVPRKVARISRPRANKRLRRHKSEKISKPGSSYKFLKSLPHTPDNKRPQIIKTFGSNEELLAFFESTKSWREINHEKSASDKNTTKDKVVYKPTTNGDISSKKTPSKLPPPTKINPPTSPTKTPIKSPGTPGAKTLPKTPESTAPPTPLIKKVPMNKIQVGAVPSPNLKIVRSKVGSLVNTTHKPGGGNIKIETHKIDLSKAQPRIEAKNDQYKPSGGDKKIEQVKLQWSAKSKVGSLENATYKPGGGGKKIESVKLDFKEKAKPKVGSKDNVKHVPGGGNIKIENQKLEFKAQSKVGSLDNVKHKPGGGDIKIFDDKTYLRQVSANCSEGRASGTQSYKDLSTAGDIESRSTPGTPGRRTTNIKIRKIITLHSFEESPKIEKTTEVIVASQTKRDKKSCKSPAKQQVTVTYSKISSLKHEDTGDSVEMIKVPAKNYAPTLRPSLSKRDVLDSRELNSQANKNKNEFYENHTLLTKEKNKIHEQIFESPRLPDGKSNLGDDSGVSKFLQDQMATQEKIGEIWQEMNATGIKYSNRLHEDQSKQPVQTFSLEHGKNLQFKTQDSVPDTDTVAEPQDSNLYTVLKSFKKLHRTGQSVFKNNVKVMDTIRKEINDNYKKNKIVSGSEPIEELIKFASDVTHELKTTVAEFEEVAPGRFRLKLRPEMFEEQENSKQTKLSK